MGYITKSCERCSNIFELVIISLSTMTNVVSLPEFTVGAYRFTREPFARLQT